MTKHEMAGKRTGARKSFDGVIGSDVITEMVSLRRYVHAHPELSFEEVHTSALIARTLEGWGIPTYRNLGKTGLVGVIKRGSSSRAIGIRADMDALPVTECNAFPHVSTHPGMMHACGHDGHVAMLLAAAKHLVSNVEFEGTVYLLFQPAEESGGGARAVINDGLFDRFPMQAIFGAHNWPGLSVGQFSVRSGAAFASSNEFRIGIQGRGAHAAMPHTGVDPIPAACAIVQSLQTIITRNKDPITAGLISVSSIHAGVAANVMADSCRIEGTVRTFSSELTDMIEARIRTIVHSTCQAFGASGTLEFSRCYPPTVNHVNETAFVRDVLTALSGSEGVRELDPSMGAEDFSFYLLERPGCYFLIGNGDGSHCRKPDENLGECVLHSPHYDFNDELISIGGTAWVRLVEAWFS